MEQQQSLKFCYKMLKRIKICTTDELMQALENLGLLLTKVCEYP